MKIKIILPLVLLLLGYNYSSACTNLIVGKAASADGSTIVSYSADNFGMFGELCHFRAGFHPLGSMRDIWDRDTHLYHGQIKEAAQTFNVIGNINEFQVTIGETTWGGREELADSTGIIDYGSLMNIALQRAHTAREAIKVMTSLVAEYGYNSEGESFTIADPNEVWIMDMIGKGPGSKGAVWVAVRIPDDCISAHANHCRIHQFNMKDKKNCMYSADVISFARSKGYFSGKDKDFSFADTYNPLDFGGRRYCEARVWSFFNLFTDRGKEFLPYIKGDTDVPMPLYVKANRKLSVQDVKEAMRDHYENTPLDISKDMGAGPFHMPYRMTPLSFKVDGKEYFNERPISTFQTAFVFVAQMRANLPNAIGGVLWFGTDDANCTVFTPVYCCTDTIPLCYSHLADGANFSWESSFWVFNWVSNMIYPRYDMMIGDLKKLQHEIEGRFNHNQDSIEQVAASLLASNPATAKKMLSDYSVACAQSTHDTWRKLGEFLMVKYIDGTVRPEKDGKILLNKGGMTLDVKRPGYSEDFLRLYVKETGDRYQIPAQKADKK